MMTISDDDEDDGEDDDDDDDGGRGLSVEEVFIFVT